MNDKLLEALIAQAPLVAALGAIWYWTTPKLIRSVLSNGGGDIIRGIVRTENAEQSKETIASIDKALKAHEEREWRQYGSLGEGVAQVRERVAALDARVSDHLAARSA